MNNETIEIKRENLLAAYQAADVKEMRLLENLFGEEFFKPKDVRDRVKTFGDACEELGEDHPLVAQYYAIFDNFLDRAEEKDGDDITAYLKLRVITTALNEGWEPEFAEDERRFYPWLYLYTREEINEMSDKEKRRMALRSYHNANAKDGVTYASTDTSYDSSRTCASIGSRLALQESRVGGIRRAAIRRALRRLLFQAEINIPSWHR